MIWSLYRKFRAILCISVCVSVCLFVLTELDSGLKHSNTLTKKDVSRHLPHVSYFHIKSTADNQEQLGERNSQSTLDSSFEHLANNTTEWASEATLTKDANATDQQHSISGKRIWHTDWNHLNKAPPENKDIRMARTATFLQMKQETNLDSAARRTEEKKDDAGANVGWKPPLNAGENGTGVVVDTEQLTVEQLQAMKDGYKKYGFNEFVSNFISLHRSLPPSFNEQECRSIQYRSDLPEASVVIIFYNEAWSVLLRTVHSVLHRSPPHLLSQLILVDDFSDLAHLGQPLEDYVSRWRKVRVVRAASREGLIRARLLGLRHVTATTVVFLDSHCECAEGWLEPLLARIAENASHVVVPRIHSIDSKTFQYKQTSLDKLYVGTFQWSLLFSWMPIQPAEQRRRKSSVDPVRSPTMAGGLFAINRDFFHKLGTYDPGMKIWGGENLELSFKIWMCEGTLEMIPCSNVGHVFRPRAPYASGNNIARNLARLAAVWLDDYRVYYEQAKLSYKPEDVGDISERQELRRRLQCHSFGWYMKHVLPEKYFPADLIAHGPIINDIYNVSINAFGGNLSVTAMNDQKRRIFLQTEWSMYVDQAAIVHRTYCWYADLSTAVVILQKCHGNGGNQEWQYLPGLQRLYHISSGQCAQLAEDAKLTANFKLVLSPCNHDNLGQHWLWDTSPLTGPSWRKDEAAGTPVL